MKQLFGHPSIHLSVLESLRVKGFSVNSLAVLKPANGFDPKACQCHQRSPNKYYSLTCLSDKALLKSLFRQLVGKSRVGVLNVCVRGASLILSLSLCFLPAHLLSLFTLGLMCSRSITFNYCLGQGQQQLTHRLINDDKLWYNNTPTRRQIKNKIDRNTQLFQLGCCWVGLYLQGLNVSVFVNIYWPSNKLVTRMYTASSLDVLGWFAAPLQP